MLTDSPVTAIGCVIDRPGYDARYRPKYGRNQWHLCQTAFAIVVERAAKHALSLGRRLRVMPEKSARDDENRIQRYYEMLRVAGLPFDHASSSLYRPLTAEQFKLVLLELRFKSKTSPLIQIADLYLWPLAMERYRPGGRAYEAFRQAGRLIECYLAPEEAYSRGSKYSCFELVDRSALGF
jgi:hypothetical protein